MTAVGALYTVPAARWRAVLAGGRVLLVGIVCPGCGAPFALDLHTIAEDGGIAPGLECPTEGCEFATLARLDGWVLGRVSFQLEGPAPATAEAS